jgi:hypothetical protein
MKSAGAPGPALRLIVAAVVLALALGGCGGSTAPKTKSSQRGMTEDIGGVIEEKEFREIEVAFPPYPQDSALLEFLPRRNSENHFYVDRNSISIGADRVIRYSVVVRSPHGALTTSYEAMRCKTSEYKVYAFGITSGEWTKSPDSQWRKIPRLTGDFRFTLYMDYYCDNEAIAGRNAQDLIANLTGNPLNNVTDKYR